jgi:transcription antitermination factor NusG
VGLNGEIASTNSVTQKLQVLVSIFGREAPVELENWQVEKYEEEK